MDERSLFEHNLELSTEFSRYLCDHPEIEDQIPEGAQIVFAIDTDSEWTQRNFELARKNNEPGQPVVIVHVKALAPRRSRLIDPYLDLAAHL